MDPVEHATVGSLVSALGIAGLWLLGPPSTTVLAALFLYGLIVSVFIDLDHFPLARLQTGHWGHFWKAVRNLPGVLVGRTKLFEPAVADRLRPRRLASHVVLGAVLAGAGWVLDPAVTVFTVLVVGAHLTCDVLRDRELL
ncbi:MAG: hypothetical protein ACI9YT_001215 [Halobacteriales archaeon]|jgi:hypothetical protein